MLPSDFAGRVDNIAQHFGGSVTSCRRTREHNALVGGVENSPHVYGVGADVVWDKVPELPRVQGYAMALNLHVIREKDHDHFQPVDWRPA